MFIVFLSNASDELSPQKLILIIAIFDDAFHFSRRSRVHEAKNDLLKGQLKRCLSSLDVHWRSNK